MVSQDKTRVTSYNNQYGYYGYRRGYAYGWGGPTNVDVRQYTEGTLSVDIYDPQERRPVWHGRATRKITKSMQENPTEALNEILTNVFASFPPY